MDFITIDFETANSNRNSPCELGLTFVKNSQVIETKSWLIKPQGNKFDDFNTYIHGIRAEDVRDKPEFNELWPEIKSLIENNFLIAHNASFDFGVLRRTLETYDLSFPELSFSCSYIFSKKVWTGLPAYDLKTLCKINNIPLNHHRAGDDSKAAAELSLNAFRIKEISSFDDFSEKLNVIPGKLFDGGYRATETKRIYSSNITTIIGDPTKHNLESIFYGKTVVFTGTLSSMVRSEAQKIIVDIGGIIGSTVTKETNYLIVGQQDYRVVGDDGMSSKQEKAIKLIEKGATLEIISETDFLKHL